MKEDYWSRVDRLYKLNKEEEMSKMKEFLERKEVVNFHQKKTDEELEEVEILTKYEGYIQKEQELVEKSAKYENIALHEDFTLRVVLNV